MYKKYPIFLLLLLIVVSGIIRSVSWDKNVLNIDELEWIYLLHRIKVSSMPFTGFVAHTTGPLAVFILSIINLFQRIPTLEGLRIFQFFFCIVPTFIILYNVLTKKAKWYGVVIFFLLVSSPELNYGLFKPYDDFYAYNTEFQVMLFLAIIYYLQQRNKISKTLLFLLVAFIFGLFFIKIQALPFVIYFWGLYFLQLLWLDRTKLFYYLTFSVISIVAVCGIFSLVGIWDDFIFEYLFKNFEYSHAENLSLLPQLVNIYIVWIFPLAYFWVLLFGVIFIGIYISWKFKKKPIVSFDFLKPIAFFLFTLIVLLVSVNNFTHYKVLLFFPMSLAIGELCGTLIPSNWQKKTISLLIISFFGIYNEFFLDMIHLKIADEKEKKNMNIGFKPHYALSANPFWTTNSTLDLEERETVLQFSKTFIKQKKLPQKLYIFGWFTAQGFYYELLKYANPISKTSHNNYLIAWYLHKKWKNFQREENELLNQFQQEKPEIIMDAEGIVEILKNQRIGKYVYDNYQLIYQTKHFQIWEIR